MTPRKARRCLLLTLVLGVTICASVTPGSDDEGVTTAAPDKPSSQASRGEVIFADRGRLWISPQGAFLRIKADLTSIFKFAIEALHHFKSNFKPTFFGYIDYCGTKGSFLSGTMADRDRQGWFPGRINSTHFSGEGTFDDADADRAKMRSECGDKIYNRARTDQSVAYGYDVAMSLNFRRLSRCVTRMERRLLRFVADSQSWQAARSARDTTAGILGMGGLALGLVNWWTNKDLEPRVGQLQTDVRGLIGESHHFSKTIAAIIDAEARRNRYFTKVKESTIRSRSLVLITTITGATCEATENLRHVTTELEEGRFPQDLFTDDQLKDFIEELDQSLENTSLSLISKEIGQFWTQPVESVIVPIKEYIPKEDLDRYGSTAVNDRRVVMTDHGAEKIDGKPALYWKNDMADGQDVYNKAIVDLTHTGHKFDSVLLPQSRRGLELTLRVQFPLKEKTDGAPYHLHQMHPGLIALPHHGTEEEGELAAPPLVALPTFQGGLLVKDDLKGRVLSEVSAEFIGGCQHNLKKQEWICPGTVEPVEPECLVSIFSGEKMEGRCYKHFRIISGPDSKPVFTHRAQGEVMVYLPGGQRMFTTCPDQTEQVQVQENKEGLFKVHLPEGCLLKAGELVWTNLPGIEVETSLELDLDVQNFTQLHLAARLEEESAWRVWEELKQENQEEAKTFWTLRQRLSENIIQRLWREHPRMSVWATLAAGGLLVTLGAAATFCACKWHRSLKAKLRLERSAWRSQARRQDDRDQPPNSVQLQLLMPPAVTPRAAAPEEERRLAPLTTSGAFNEVVFAPPRRRRFDI